MVGWQLQLCTPQSSASAWDDTQTPVSHWWCGIWFALSHVSLVGLPYFPYDGAVGEWKKGSVWWGGYCQHGSTLFPTWHRPYVLLIERSVQQQGEIIAAAQSTQALQADVSYVAKRLRIPYFDWASMTAAALGMPTIFTDIYVDVLYPQAQRLPNPLRSFVVPDAIGKQLSVGDQFSPHARPNYVVRDQLPYLPLGFATIRWPTAAYTSNDDKLSMFLARSSLLGLREQVSDIFLHSDWDTFSNHTYAGEQEDKIGKKVPLSSYGHYSSLELVHDQLHSVSGGPGGTLSYPAVAGFDPFFYFHHCNVDRLLAMWQRAHPKAWMDNDIPLKMGGTFTIPPQTVATGETPLTPFYNSSAKTDFFTSNQVRDINQLGYTYPDVEANEQYDEVEYRKWCLSLYKSYTQWFSFNWYANFVLPKNLFDGTYTLRLFIDLPTANAHTPHESPHYAGSIYVFARDKQDVKACPTCREESTVCGSILLNQAMIKLGIAHQPVIADPTFATPDNGSGSRPDVGSAFFDNPFDSSLNKQFKVVMVKGTSWGANPQELYPNTIGWTPRMQLAARQDFSNYTMKELAQGEYPVDYNPAPVRQQPARPQTVTQGVPQQQPQLQSLLRAGTSQTDAAVKKMSDSVPLLPGYINQPWGAEPLMFHSFTKIPVYSQAEPLSVTQPSLKSSSVHHEPHHAAAADAGSTAHKTEATEKQLLYKFDKREYDGRIRAGSTHKHAK